MKKQTNKQYIRDQDVGSLCALNGNCNQHSQQVAMLKEKAPTSIRFVTVNGTEHRLGHSYSHHWEIVLFVSFPQLNVWHALLWPSPVPFMSTSSIWSRKIFFFFNHCRNSGAVVQVSPWRVSKSHHAQIRSRSSRVSRKTIYSLFIGSHFKNESRLWTAALTLSGSC